MTPVPTVIKIFPSMCTAGNLYICFFLISEKEPEDGMQEVCIYIWLRNISYSNN